MNGTQELKVAVAQFTVRREPEWNLDIIDGYAWQAADAGARLLVLPEGLIARDGQGEAGGQAGMLIARLHREVLESARRTLPVLENRRFADPQLRD